MAKTTSKTTSVDTRASETSATSAADAPAAPPLPDTQPTTPPEDPPTIAAAEASSAPEIAPVLNDPPPPAEAPAKDVAKGLIEEIREFFEPKGAEDLLLKVREIAAMTCDKPVPEHLSAETAAKMIEGFVEAIDQSMTGLAIPRMVRMEIDEHRRRMISRARRLAAPPAKPVEYFEVTATSRYILNGSITTLHEGSIISSLTHTIADVEAQKVPLRRCGAPQAMPSSSASGFQVSPTRDFEIVEHSDPLLRALGSRS